MCKFVTMDIGDMVTARIRTIRGYEDYTGVVIGSTTSCVVLRNVSSNKSITVSKRSILK